MTLVQQIVEVIHDAPTMAQVHWLPQASPPLRPPRSSRLPERQRAGPIPAGSSGPLVTGSLLFGGARTPMSVPRLALSSVVLLAAINNARPAVDPRVGPLGVDMHTTCDVRTLLVDADQHFSQRLVNAADTSCSVRSSC